MKNLSGNTTALLGLAFIGAVLMVISQTTIVTDSGILSTAGLVALIAATIRLIDLTSPDRNRPGKE